MCLSTKLYSDFLTGGFGGGGGGMCMCVCGNPKRENGKNPVKTLSTNQRRVS